MNEIGKIKSKYIPMEFIPKEAVNKRLQEFKEQLNIDYGFLPSHNEIFSYESFCNFKIKFRGVYGIEYKFTNIFRYLDYVFSAINGHFRDVTREVKSLSSVSRDVNKVISRAFSCNSKVIQVGQCHIPYSKYYKSFEPLFVLAIESDIWTGIVATSDLKKFVKWIYDKFLNRYKQSF